MLAGVNGNRGVPNAQKGLKQGTELPEATG